MITDRLDAALAVLKGQRKLKGLRRLRAAKPGYVQYGNQEILDFSNWDFLNLNSDPRHKRRLHEELESTGLGRRSARLKGGNTAVHTVCERRIAEFTGCEAALLFSSRNQAVLSLVTLLVTDADAVLVPENVSGPVADAVRLVNADAVNYGSGEKSLEKQVANLPKYQQKLIYIEAVHANGATGDGTENLFNLTASEQSMVCVDETFSLGVTGIRGAGLSEILVPKPETLCILASLGRGMASYGAFIAGSSSLIEYLLQCSKTFGNETAIPPVVAEATIAAIDKIELSEIERIEVRSRAEKLRLQLKEDGVSVVEGGTQIVALRAGSMTEANSIKQSLWERQILVDAFPVNRATGQEGVVRLILNAAHSDKVLGQVAGEIVRVCS